MEDGSPLQCTVTVRRNPHRKARATPAPKVTKFDLSSAISPCPFPEIVAIEAPPNPKNNPSSLSSSVLTPLSENLKVYLRVRPISKSTNLKKSGHAGGLSPRGGSKNVWPQNPEKKKVATVKKKSSGACIRVNDSYSVTVSPPLELQETRRSKSEVYEGFSHVFSMESSQDEVYGRMVCPLVEDFLSGKSGMLTALGPSGSGKTHTIFGCPRDPGMVPLALQHIFKESSDSQLRSYYLSIFEIYSEKGKGEKIYDLSSDGAELNMHQFTVKGLKEVLISSSREAESLVACAMTKRATATTNANSKSSRSQCIMNIRRAACQEEVDDPSNCAILTIVDLAGAEREKRTGNQGTRLLEANFINNTSMVFGLCLRSLFEHQKNPKKPLQKHFQNSLLTKYLRDYLEGKKRMTLILTVKAGEEDYLDTSYLLRQASPYMKIKFNNCVEPSNKRQLPMFSTFKESKKAKHSVLETCVSEGKGNQKEGPFPQEDHVASDTLAPSIEPLDTTERPGTESGSEELAGKERNHLITQSFAKAIWKVLKQYRDKLKTAENEIQNLQEEIKNERIRYVELENQRQNSRCSCTCSKEICAEAVSIEVGSSFQSRNNFEKHNFNDVHEINLKPSIQMKESDGNITTKRHGSSPREHMTLQHGIQSGSKPNEVDEAYSSHGDENTSSNERSMVYSSTHLGANDDHLTENFTGDNIVLSELNSGSPQSLTLVKNDSCSSVELDEYFSEQNEVTKTSAQSPVGGGSFIHFGAHNCKPEPERTSLSQSTSEKPDRDSTALSEDKELSMKRCDFQHRPPIEDVALASFEECNTNMQSSKPKADISGKVEKPKRRLLPASSTLLRDFSYMHVNDDIEAPKVNRSGKKSAVDEKNRTQGSISLMRMLKSNLRTK